VLAVLRERKKALCSSANKKTPSSRLAPMGFSA
jgi:hypothetical protein